MDVESWDVKCYDASHRGWIALSSDVSFDLAVDDAAGSARVDVQLFRRQVAASGAATQAPGFFTIGAVGMKNVNNLGSLWRTAYQMGAAQIFTIGGRYEPQASDTVKCWRSTPLLRMMIGTRSQPRDHLVRSGSRSSLEASRYHA